MTRLQKNTAPPLTRRSFLKRTGAALIGFAGICAMPFYGYFHERSWLELVETTIHYPSLPAGFDQIKIVHFSDVHYGFYYEEEQLAQLVDRILQIKPDLIVYTGDLFDAEVTPYAEACIQQLSRLHAPLGKFAVPGNHDYYTGPVLAMNAYIQSGFTLLRNQSARLSLRGDSLQLVGLDDMFYGNPDLNQAFSGLDADRFTLLLAHEPDFALRTSAYRVDLQLSGHSHGGQVRLPLIGALITPTGGRHYVQGLHSLDNQDGVGYIYTTRGIGTTHVPIRFLCRPELSVLTLKCGGPPVT